MMPSDTRVLLDLRVELESLLGDTARVRTLDSNRREALEEIVGRTVHAVIVYDASKKLVVANRAAERLWAARGVTPERTSSQRYMVVAASGPPVPVEDWVMERALAHRERALERASGLVADDASEIVVERADGSRGFAVAYSAPMLDEEGRVVGAVAAFAELTPSKESAETTQSAHRRASFLVQASTKLLSTSLDPDATLAQLAHLAVPTIADACTVDLVDDETVHGQRRVVDVWADPARGEVARRLREEYDTVGDEGPGLARVIRTGIAELHSVVVDSMLKWVARDAVHFELLRQLGVRSVMIVPLIARRRVIGAVSFMCVDSGRSFEPADLDMAEQLGVNAGLAVENARLYQYEQQARATIERAANRMQRLQAIMTDLASALTSDDVANAVIGHGVPAVGAIAGVIWTVDEQAHELRLLRSSRDMEVAKQLYGVISLGEPGPVADAVETRAPVYVRTREEFSQSYPLVATRFVDIPATASLPLLVRGRVCGLLGFAFDRPRTFDADERAFLSLIAAHCAQGLYRARMYEAEQNARSEMALLYGLVDSVHRATTMEEIFDAALEVLHRALKVTRSAIVLKDADGRMRFKAWRGLSDEYRASVEDNFSPRWLLPESILLPNVEAAEGHEARERLLGEGVRGFAAFALIHKGEVVGKFVAYSAEPRAFTEDEQRLAQTIAAQLSQAVVRKAAEAEVEAARAAAEYASRMKDEFLAVVSHELRTPLSSITGWASILQTDRRNDPAILAKGLSVIERNAKAQATIIEDILDVSRIIRGKLVLDPHPVTFVPLVAETIESLRTSATAKQIDVEFEAADDDYSLVGDPERLRQIAWNLLSNAIKFTPANGKVRVRLRRQADAIALDVEDSGRGIEPEFLPYVFDRFRQADSSSTRREGGLGLGLSIVRHLVELHGGSVAVKSEGRGKGATFTAFFPVRAIAPVPPLERANGDDGDAITSPAAGSVPPPTPPPDLDGIAVLVVDDQPDAREMLSEALASYGAKVVVAGSAREALAVLKNFCPRILVTDIGMPDEDGYALLRAVRAMPNHAELPAIAVTAYARAEDAKKSKLAGFQSHVAKPVRPDALAAAVMRALAPGLAELASLSSAT